VELTPQMESLMLAVSINQVGKKIYKRQLKKGLKKGLFQKQTRYVLTKKGEDLLRERYPEMYSY
jgi:predicted transcriptional regulator